MFLRPFLTLSALVLFVASCGSTEVPDASSSASPGLLELAFDERMAIRARLTTIHTEAKTEAALEHDQFTSKEETILYEKRVAVLRYEKQAALLNEYSLTENDLDLIVDEYLRSQGTQLSE